MAAASDQRLPETLDWWRGFAGADREQTPPLIRPGGEADEFPCYRSAPLSRLTAVTLSVESAVASTLAQFKDMVSGGVTPESLYALRGQFIVSWFNSDNAKKFPYKLFDRQQQLLKLGIFEAYNQWAFSSYNEDRFKNWAQMNNGLIQEFAKFQRASMFRVPQEEYYGHN